MMEEVKKMSQYQGFLDSVLEVEEEYPEIADLLARHETLSAARADLIKRQDRPRIRMKGSAKSCRSSCRCRPTRSSTTTTR